MIYRVLPDEDAAKSKYRHVADNEGEDYLYPSDYFISFDVSDEIERALLRAA
jgi:hypothetical protein